MTLTLEDYFSAIDSPLCPKLAPELYAMRPKVVDLIRKYSRGCQPCQAARKREDFALLEIELANIITKDTAIAAVIPHLILARKKT